MDSTILQKDLFIGKSELQTTFDGLSDYSKKFLKSIVKTYGLMNNSNDIYFTNFKVIQGTSNNYITLQAGIAFDANLNLIKLDADYINISSVTSGTTYYVILQNMVTSQELGTCSIDSDGVVSGINTEFLRFRSGDFAQRIKFLNSSLNTNSDEYEINSITNNTQLQLTGNSFSVESNLTYKILGNFTYGATISDKTAFTYNRPSVTLATSNTSDGLTSFCLASVYNNGSNLAITDLRTQLLIFTGNYTDTNAQTLINKIKVGTSTATINSGVLNIDKTNTYYEITGDNSFISDIVYSDNSTVDTGKIIFLKIASTGFNFRINGYSGSNITFQSNTPLQTLSLVNDFIILIKTSTKWVLHGGDNDVRNILAYLQNEITALQDSAWLPILSFGTGFSTLSITGSRELSYKSTGTNKLWINGVVTAADGTYAYGAIIFTLPSIFPSYNTMGTFNTIYVDHPSKFYINTLGQVILQENSLVLNSDQLYFNAIIPLD